MSGIAIAQKDALQILEERIKRQNGYSYRVDADKYGLDTITDDVGFEVNESEMSFTLHFANGNRRDGVGDLLEISGIDTGTRHRSNPLTLWDHGKDYKLPIGKFEHPDAKEYTVILDPIAKIGKGKVFMYQGRGGMVSLGRDQENDHALFCQQIFDLWCKRFIRAGSIGYQVIEARQLQPDYDRGTQAGLHLIRILMLEGSAVVLPANADTVVTKNLIDQAREILAMPYICGKSLSPILRKSIEPYAEQHTKTAVGFADLKAHPAQQTGDVQPEKLPHDNLTETNIPPAEWKPGEGATKDIDKEEKALVVDKSRAKRELEKAMVNSSLERLGIMVSKKKNYKSGDIEYTINGIGPFASVEDAAQVFVEEYAKQKKSLEDNKEEKDFQVLNDALRQAMSAGFNLLQDGAGDWVPLQEWMRKRKQGWDWDTAKFDPGSQMITAQNEGITYKWRVKKSLDAAQKDLCPNDSHITLSDDYGCPSAYDSKRRGLKSCKSCGKSLNEVRFLAKGEDEIEKHEKMLAKDLKSGMHVVFQSKSAQVEHMSPTVDGKIKVLLADGRKFVADPDDPVKMGQKDCASDRKVDAVVSAIAKEEKDCGLPHEEMPKEKSLSAIRMKYKSMRMEKKTLKSKTKSLGDVRKKYARKSFPGEIRVTAKDVQVGDRIAYFSRQHVVTKITRINSGSDQIAFHLDNGDTKYNYPNDPVYITPSGKSLGWKSYGSKAWWVVFSRGNAIGTVQARTQDQAYQLAMQKYPQTGHNPAYNAPGGNDNLAFRVEEASDETSAREGRTRRNAQARERYSDRRQDKFEVQIEHDKEMADKIERELEAGIKVASENLENKRSLLKTFVHQRTQRVKRGMHNYDTAVVYWEVEVVGSPEGKIAGTIEPFNQERVYDALSKIRKYLIKENERLLNEEIRKMESGSSRSGARYGSPGQYGFRYRKSLDDVRLKYKKVKGLRRRLKTGKSGSSMILVRGKDIDNLMKEAEEKGLTINRAGKHTNGLEKVKLTGHDDHIDAMAKKFGRSMRKSWNKYTK